MYHKQISDSSTTAFIFLELYCKQNVFGYPCSPSQELHFLNMCHYFMKHNVG